MDNTETLLDFNFTESKSADTRFEKCTQIKIMPSQSEKILLAKGFGLLFVTSGKGSIYYSDKRIKITQGSAAFFPNWYTIQIKSDTLEPLVCTLIKLSGDYLKTLFALIEKKEDSIVMNFDNDTRIQDCVNELVTDCSKSYKSDYSLMMCFYELMSIIDDHYIEKKVPNKNAYMVRAIEYIKGNYNKNISVENIADMLGIERSYLSRLFKAYKNKSTQNYIIDYRIRQAKKLFEEEDMNVSQVSVAVGYNNIYCFSRIFKNRVGIPPKEYMENCKKKSL